ncbi:MAG TPA: hypothetical protein VFZ19_12380 [Solirubrobacterales bacterium]
MSRPKRVSKWAVETLAVAEARSPEGLGALVIEGERVAEQPVRLILLAFEAADEAARVLRRAPLA